MSGIDQWLGGVHLRDGNLWRGDEVAQFGFGNLDAEA